MHLINYKGASNMKLSIGMIVKNESKYLERCLTALKPILDNVTSELIIVDTGSTDGTVDIAKRFTDKVLYCQWNNDFSEARNKTLEKAEGDWYFYLDADEMLENPEEIINFFCSNAHLEYQAFAIKIENLVDENRNSVVEVFYSKRIVKRDKSLKFKGKIHEYLPEKSPVFMSQSVLVHYGYVKSDEKLVVQKYRRNIDILNMEIKNDPNNIFLLYHLVKTHNFLGDYLEGLKWARKALEIANKIKLASMSLYNLVIDTYIKNGLFADAENVAEKLLKEIKVETNAHINTYFYLAQAQSMLRKNSEAINNYIKCSYLLDAEKRNNLPVDFNSTRIEFGGNKFISWQIAVLYDGLLDFDSAYEWANKAMNLWEEENDFQSSGQTLKYIVKLCFKYKKYDHLVKLFRSIIDTNDEEIRTIKEDIITGEIEENILGNINYKETVIEKFSEIDIDNDYVFLNRIRKKIGNNEMSSYEDIEKIRSFNFYGKPEYYGELIYYMMKQDVDIEDIMLNLDEKEINKYITYMDKAFTDLPYVILDYFETREDRLDLNYCIFSKAFKRVVLIKGKIPDNKYMQIFNRYLAEGIFYIEEVYNEAILNSENACVLKNDEEVFFMYMRKAYQYKQIDKSSYLKYLKLALNAYEYMFAGIRLLLEELKKQVDEVTDSPDNIQNEFEEYKNILKKNIAFLLEEKEIGQAKALIDEYLKIVPDDLEMLMLKSEVQLQLM